MDSFVPETPPHSTLETPVDWMLRVTKENNELRAQLAELKGSLERIVITQDTINAVVSSNMSVMNQQIFDLHKSFMLLSNVTVANAMPRVETPHSKSQSPVWFQQQRRQTSSLPMSPLPIHMPKPKRVPSVDDPISESSWNEPN